MPFSRLLNSITLGLALLLLVPASLILASWNALPGDSLYSTKRGLERVALTVLSPNYQAETSLHTRLIARRLEEADATIDKKASSRGLDELSSQLHQAKAQIDQAPNAQAKKQAAQKLVQVLATTNDQLETKKQTLATTIVSETRYVVVHEREIVREIVREVPTPALTPTPSPTPPADTPEIIEDIEDVQEEIQDIIAEVNQETASTTESVSPPPAEDTGRGQSDEHRQDDKDKPDKPED